MDIPAEKLAPGDIIMLEAGDVIAADGRLFEANQLQCDESSLTGESLPTIKNTEELTKDTALGDRVNMIFKGSSVMNGNGKAVTPPAASPSRPSMRLMALVMPTMAKKVNA